MLAVHPRTSHTWRTWRTSPTWRTSLSWRGGVVADCAEVGEEEYVKAAMESVVERIEPVSAGGARLSEVLKVHASKHFESVKGGCTILYTFYKTHQF